MNIKEVARQAGVSVATVSRVLNHPELVQPETKNRVLAVMESLQYTPNWFARGLNLGKTHIIALVVSSLQHELERDLFAGVETVALEKGYATVLCSTHGQAEIEAACLRMVQDRKADGILINAPSMDLSALRTSGIPWVGIGQSRNNQEEDCCYINCEDGAYRMTRHLLSLGHRRLTLLLDKEDPEDRRHISAGFRRAILEQEGQADGRVIPGENSVQGGFIAAARLFQEGTPPDALLCDSDEMAFGVLKAARDASLSIPSGMGLACLTDSPLCSILTPSLTALEQPARRLGMVAARLLFDLLEQDEHSERVPQEIVLQPKLKLRQSCGNHPHISELYDG